MWGPNQQSQRFPKPLSNPVARPWTPPKLPLALKRMPTVVDADWRPPLKVQADEWEVEADRLEASPETDTPRKEPAGPTFLPIEIEVGLVLLKLEKEGITLQQQLQEWDKTGDGTISRGEWRIRLRTLGLANEYPTADVDELFAKYDEDSSGTINLRELKSALKRLKNRTVAHCAREAAAKKLAEPPPRAKELRAKANAAREAITCANRADTCEDELAELRVEYSGRIDLQLGALLAKRHIQVGEMVRLWPKPRAKSLEAHSREISKEEFKDEVTMLNLVVSALSPPPPLALPSSRHGAPSTRSVHAPSARVGANGLTKRRTGSASVAHPSPEAAAATAAAAAPATPLLAAAVSSPPTASGTARTIRAAAKTTARTAARSTRGASLGTDGDGSGTARSGRSARTPVHRAAVIVDGRDGATEADGSGTARSGVSGRSARSSAGAASARRRAGARRGLASAFEVRRPVTRKELGLLFDTIDADGSGWLDVRELTEALRTWQSAAAEALSAQASKEEALTQLRKRASRLLKLAHRPLTKGDAEVDPARLLAAAQDARIDARHGHHRRGQGSDRSKRKGAASGGKKKGSASGAKAGSKPRVADSSDPNAARGVAASPPPPPAKAQVVRAREADEGQSPQDHDETMIMLVHAPTPRMDHRGSDAEPSARSTGSQPTRRLVVDLEATDREDQSPPRTRENDHGKDGARPRREV